MSASLHLAVRNAEALTTALARTRGHELVTRPGFLAMTGPSLSRVLVRRPDPAADDLDEIRSLVGRAEARVVVEDSFGAVDGAALGLTALGLTAGHLPVMVREPGPLPAPAVEVTRVRTAAELAVAERVVVDGFPMSGFPPGQALPAGLLDADGFHLHLARRAGEPAGACLTVVGEGVGGVYWVATLPAHRSRGVGRALVHAVLNEFPVPMTLTATAAGRPLYDSLGFSVVARATWWSND
ncbi:GNAT family N-acetyltransferase [Saccharothrix xinjiangensis]|uniref:GNAT family N-acetyltransferase n=1 Tax=Saccharothrix xinjiangensis TaxID=204798 RepID=A0ABV9XVU1_9PSEU